MFKSLAWMLVVGACLLGIGCGHVDALASLPRLSDEPIGVQMMRAAPELKQQRFRNLLSFESDNDLIFVAGAAADSIQPETARAHTGRRAVRVAGGMLRVRLAALASDGNFPADWTLVGAYFYTERPVEITVSLQSTTTSIGRRKLQLPAGRWSAVMADIVRLSGSDFVAAQGAVPDLVFTWDPNVRLWCDDVVLIDNTQTLLALTDDAHVASTWTVRRRGLNYLVDAPGRFTFELPLAEHVPGGWVADELNAMRLRFGSAGAQKWVTVYSDGRAYVDGEFRALGSGADGSDLAPQHLSPGHIDVPEEQGRVDRNTPGDANNDGYNEARGAYQVRATGPRLELMVWPRDVPLVNPVIEIDGMPEGKIRVTVEGRLVESVIRLPDGHVLIDLPARVSRATAINVSVQQSDR